MFQKGNPFVGHTSNAVPHSVGKASPPHAMSGGREKHHAPPSVKGRTSESKKSTGNQALDGLKEATNGAFAKAGALPLPQSVTPPTIPSRSRIGWPAGRPQARPQNPVKGLMDALNASKISGLASQAAMTQGALE